MTMQVVYLLQEHAVVAAAAERTSSGWRIAGVAEAPIDGSEASLRAAGRSLAERLEPRAGKRAAAIGVVRRSAVAWQSIETPPVPPSELPEIVRFQAQRDWPAMDEEAGFDFLPLAEPPGSNRRTVLAAFVMRSEMTRLRLVAESAGWRLTKISAEPLGWLELVQQDRRAERGAAGGSPRDAGPVPVTWVDVASEAGHATIWTTLPEGIAAVRRVVLPSERAPPTLVREIRRTLAGAAAATDGGEVRLTGWDPPSAAAASEAGTSLATAVQRRDAAQLVEFADDVPAAWREQAAWLASLAGLIGPAAPGLIDFAHPRRPPAPQASRRPLVLGAAAASLIVAALAWQGYRQLRDPVVAASTAIEQRAALQPMIDKLSVEEAEAATIGDWLTTAAPALDALGAVSAALRPLPLADPAFAAGDDLQATRWNANATALSVSVSAKRSEALALAEQRLREAGYRVERGPVEFNSKEVEGYPVSTTLQLAAPPADFRPAAPNSSRQPPSSSLQPPVSSVPAP